MNKVKNKAKAKAKTKTKTVNKTKVGVWINTKSAMRNAPIINIEKFPQVPQFF